ncbi:16S rRNA (guanine(966)-N(2))-methyltransferase RsmD [bacterium]|nr:16S rRNA (guanine(966)-N(2))-methyltransferase RsmD [bacterium]
MRIISGKHKGRNIIAPNNLPVRPTSDRAKEALFNILESKYYFKGKNLLDLFSGTGNISYEFCSRGIKHSTCVEKNNNCINFIEKTISELDFNISTIKSDSMKYLENCKKKFNFIFVDPPYNYDNYEELKQLIIDRELLEKDGILVIEHDHNTKFNDKKVEVRKYGKVHFSLYSF